MKAISITQIEATIIEGIKQDLLEKSEEVGLGIQGCLIGGDVRAATQTLRDLLIWFEGKIWKIYLNTLLNCETILAWLRALGSRKALRFVSYQEVSVTLPTGEKITIKSPYYLVKNIINFLSVQIKLNRFNILIFILNVNKKHK